MIQQKTIKLRPPEIVMQPRRMGAIWASRISFARQLVLRVQRGQWRVERAKWELDDDGRGEVIYRVQTPQQAFHFVLFSTKLAEDERTDRVIAERWDAAAALCEGEMSEVRLAQLRANVPKQEYGRADHETLVWTRGNRSSRFFNHVVDCLAAGRQPDVDLLAQGGYIFRSTAYYANTKFGLRAYDAIGDDHPLAGTFQAQMLAAWLFREYAVDLAEHIAATKSSDAVKLARPIRRFLGIGNATGMGLVPFVVNNPQVTHAWCWVRETAVSQIKHHHATQADATKLRRLLAHCQTYFGEDLTETKGLFTEQAVLIRDLQVLEKWVAEWIEAGTINGRLTSQPWQTLCEAAYGNIDIESEELLHTLLMECYPDLCDALLPQLEKPHLAELDPTMTLERLQAVAQESYGWALSSRLLEPKSRQLFWYFSVDSEEPLIGVRGKDAGENVERPFDIPHQVANMLNDLTRCPLDETVGYFLLLHPQHRLIAHRVQALHGMDYAESHSNLVDADYIPLYHQRFQLAMYGMERFSPQSIYWVRVTLLQGAPTAQDVAEGWDDEWVFPLKPK
ncbi:MAG: hypothetical protein AAF614_15225 [Chloroflexota bacterium]